MFWMRNDVLWMNGTDGFLTAGMTRYLHPSCCVSGPKKVNLSLIIGLYILKQNKSSLCIYLYLRRTKLGPVYLRRLKTIRSASQL